MERNIDYKDFAERKVMAEIEYISYLMSNDAFAYIIDNIFKKMEIPEHKIKPAVTPLEDIRSSVINNTRDFLNGVNLDIKWLDKYRIEELKNKYPFDYHEIIMEEAKDGSIFDIPLTFSPSYSSFIGIYEGEAEDFKDIVFKEIALLLDKKLDDDILETTYFHELTHALITRNWYMITNPLFDEYMPHLLEMIYNYHILGNDERYVKKLLQRMEARKYTELVIDKNKAYLRLTERLDLLYGLTLILSCITFEKFIDFNENNKQEMIKDIKDVLNGNITVEDFMKKYEINMDNDSAISLYERTVERVKSYNLK